MGSQPERVNGHIGTERRSKLLREAAVGNIGNGRKPDPATPREGRRSSDCKPLSAGKKAVTVPAEEVTANYVPAAAVIRRWRALSGITGCKGCVGGEASQM